MLVYQYQFPQFAFLFKINLKCVFQVKIMSAPIYLYSIRRNIDYGPTAFCRTRHVSCNGTQLFSLQDDYSTVSTTEIHDRRQHRLKTLFPLRLTQSNGHRDGAYAEIDVLRTRVEKIRTTTIIITIE